MTNEENKIGLSGFFVYMIESPSAIDLRDGRSEGSLLKEALKLAGVTCKYNLVINKEIFNACLTTQLAETVKDTGGIPIIHLSAHGNKSGIGLSDGSLITWGELKNFLLPINEALQGGLVLCISACEGYHACNMLLQENGKLPFFGFISHLDKPKWIDAAIAFTVFYHRFFKGASVKQAVEAMCIASGDKKFVEEQAKVVQADWVKYINNRRIEIKQGLEEKLREPVVD
jgi:hypothetical protein